MHTFSRADFERFGQLYDIEFRFPAIHGDPSADDHSVARGEITEHGLASGFRFTFSSLEVLEGYESVSCGHAPLLVLVVLDGIVELTLGSVEHALTPGTAVSMQLHPDYPLQAHQPEQQHLEIVALAFDPRGATLGHVSPSLHGLTTLPRVPLSKWNVPPALKELLQTYAGLTMTGVQKNLVLEGLALQLAGLGLGGEEHESPDVPVVPVQQRQRLELVRQHLEFTPDHHHTLKNLADMAAMSPAACERSFGRCMAFRSSTISENAGFGWQNIIWSKASVLSRVRTRLGTLTRPIFRRRFAGNSGFLPDNAPLTRKNSIPHRFFVFLNTKSRI